jgi:hypothetical protein
MLGSPSFNPRARVRRDTLFLIMTRADNPFQSTRPHGARLQRDFKIARIAVSIHAPAWGATPTPYLWSRPAIVARFRFNTCEMCVLPTLARKAPARHTTGPAIVFNFD